VVAPVFSEVVDCSTTLLQARMGSYEMSLIALEATSALYSLKRNDKALAKDANGQLLKDEIGG
jgi:hypothetical protein